MAAEKMPSITSAGLLCETKADAGSGILFHEAPVVCVTEITKHHKTKRRKLLQCSIDKPFMSFYAQSVKNNSS